MTERLAVLLNSFFLCGLRYVCYTIVRFNYIELLKLMFLHDENLMQSNASSLNAYLGNRYYTNASTATRYGKTA